MFKNQIVLRRLTIISILFLLVGFAPSILRSATERFPAMTDWWLTMSPSSPALLVVAEIWANLEPYLYLVRFAGAALLLASLGWALLQWYRGEGAEATADVDPVLRVSRVLLEEAEVTHGPCNDPLLIAKIDACSGTGSKEANKDTGAADPQLKDKVPPALYRWLNGLDRVALCISGGGIRSASFALGVLQAMASHPGRSRKATGATSKEHTEGRDPADDALNSYLAQIHYVSTVSGGGYIGSWLSAWLYREPFVEVWKGLVRPPSDSRSGR